MATFFAPEALRTSDFVVRWYQNGDGPAMAESISSSVEHLKPWMGWAAESHTAEECEARARKFRANCLLNTNFILGVWSLDDTRLLGGTGFHLRGVRDVWDGVGEIGMWIRGDEAGRGLGTALLKAMLAWGFSEWPWERLSWHCDSRNMASRRTAQKAGMKLEGTLRGDKADVGEGRCDTMIFGLSRADYQAC